MKDRREDNLTDKPIILEHHGIREIISIEDAEKFAKSIGAENICEKCLHYNCVCDDMYGEILDK